MLKLKIGKIETRYGTALFQLASQENQLINVIKNVCDLRQFMTEYPEIWDSFTHPTISIISQQKIILTICELFKFQALLKNFLLLLSKNRRLNLLENILTSFEDMERKNKNITKGFVTLVATISQEDILELQIYLEQILKTKIELQALKDESLLGGFILQLGNYLLDFSLKTRLFKIKQAMKG